MYLRRIFVVITSALLINFQFDWSSASLLEYIWPLRNDKVLSNTGDGTHLPAVPFDAGGPDREFLLEASKFLDKKLSELDFCQQRVVLSLKDSCNFLNEEELGKLAVKFFNCQAVNEGREVFECSDTMSLKQCTENMDHDTWNAYHLISNRAKAVCYYIQQEHFRSLTEMTVNKLMTSSQRHLERMDELKKTQQQVHKATIESIDEVIENNLKLLESQKSLMSLSDVNKANIENNIRELVKQNAILRNTQANIFKIVQELKVGIEEEISSVREKSGELLESFNKVLKKFDALNDVVDKMSSKMNEISLNVLDTDTRIKHQFSENMINLERMYLITSSVSQILSYFDNEYKSKIEWLQDQFGADGNLTKYSGLLISHITCLLLGMICLVFVNADMKNRLVFVLTIFLNFLGVFYGYIQLDAVQLLEAIFSAMTLNFIVQMFKKYNLKQYLVMRRKKKTTVSEGRTIGDTDPSGHVEPNNLGASSSTSVSNGYNSSRVTSRSVTPAYQYSRNVDDYSARSGSSHTTQNLSSVYDDNRCKGVTARGIQCRLTAFLPNTDYCRIHASQNR